MGQEEKTTLELTKGHKQVVKNLQDHLKDELGTKPTQGEAVAIAGERVMEGSA